jgi:hypothetical protein
MLLFYGSASIIGGLLTAMLLGPYNPIIGLLATPLGGSFLAALAALLIALPSSTRKQSSIPPGIVWC